MADTTTIPITNAVDVDAARQALLDALNAQRQNADPNRAVPNQTPRPPTTPAPITSAQVQVQQTLDSYGLGSLTQWAWEKVKNGENLDQIIIEMRQTPQYKARFPAMEAISKQGRALSEAEYISLESSYRQVLQAAGLPIGFYDAPDDFAKFITNDVSPSEVQARAQAYETAVFESTPEFRQHLNQYYGIDSGHLAAFFIDPDRAFPLIQKQAAAALAGSTAQTTGFGDLAKSEAERLTNLQLQRADLQKGFQGLVQDQELFNNLPGEAGDTVTRDEQLNAAFAGDQAAQREIERKRAQRKAVFQAGGGFAASDKGLAGIGNANPSQ